MAEERFKSSRGKSKRSTATAGNSQLGNFASLRAIEIEHIRRVLKATHGNRTRAADILGISRVTLLSKIKQYSLTSK